jgi:hypothetical protein
MENYSWFCQTIRKAVTLNENLARVLRAMLDGRKPRIPEDKEHHFAIEEAIENAKYLLGTKGGRGKLRRLINQHRYDAGFRTDDIALRMAFRQWVDDSRDRVIFLRVDEETRRRA